MRTNSRRREQGLVLAVLTVLLSLPELAQAQQGGLFPLAPIRRQRVPCNQEDPIYKIYKHQYFGYHPTCWRPFPNGWGCPSPEAPDRAKSFEKQKLGAGEGEMPGALPVVVSAFVLLTAAVVASMLPAARAARVDVIQALRSE